MLQKITKYFKLRTSTVVGKKLSMSGDDITSHLSIVGSHLWMTKSIVSSHLSNNKNCGFILGIITLRYPYSRNT